MLSFVGPRTLRCPIRLQKPMPGVTVMLPYAGATAFPAYPLSRVYKVYK